MFRYTEDTESPYEVEFSLACVAKLVKFCVSATEWVSLQWIKFLMGIYTEKAVFSCSQLICMTDCPSQCSTKMYTSFATPNGEHTSYFLHIE